MESQVEKMYENARIEKIHNCKGCEYEEEYICDNCPQQQLMYPIFTAEKQLKIIKFLISKYATFQKSRSYKQKDLYAVYYECRYFPKQYLPFEEALAESINYLWKDLTSEEKEQVKGILNE